MQRLTRLLSAWDRGIRQLSDLIAARLRFKHGLMQQLLTGTRRPKPDGYKGSPTASEASTLTLGFTATAIEVERGMNGKSYDEGIPALDECPNGWRTKKLGKLRNEIEGPRLSHPPQPAALLPRNVIEPDSCPAKSFAAIRSGPHRSSALRQALPLSLADGLCMQLVALFQTHWMVPLPRTHTHAFAFARNCSRSQPGGRFCLIPGGQVHVFGQRESGRSSWSAEKSGPDPDP